MANGSKSPHILNTSTNLLGFCLIVLTSIKVMHFNNSTLIDDSTGIASLLLMASCFLSFLSMRAEDERRSERLEKVADYVFLVALICVSVTIVLVSFNLIS
ncbi:hypothetical protein [Chitinophaga ginsengisoli]|uniref:Uncharacterized protein n=1 Tax=Chitinophaga ginsengisoli TaxID=363837 RepID=A0A2P8FVX2_9BACT|nr:hypothetical protein [Chitinophaga ginsengisoli]PSL25861.1 hypothetical protein CLV42_11266 [Chitinophaga ginsengisoli]